MISRKKNRASKLITVAQALDSNQLKYTPLKKAESEFQQQKFIKPNTQD